MLRDESKRIFPQAVVRILNVHEALPAFGGSRAAQREYVPPALDETLSPGDQQAVGVRVVYRARRESVRRRFRWTASRLRVAR